MKLLHTSDWHLGMTFRSGVTYYEDQRYFIDQICEIACKEKIDGILIAGDVFDKSIASQDALRLYDEAMSHICGKLGIPVFIVAGNHDGAERLSSCNQLLRKSGLYIAGALKSHPQVESIGDVDIYLLPWISTDKVRTTFPDKADQIDSLEDAYQVVLDQYRAAFVPGHKNILVSHAFIVDAQTSVSDRAAEVGQATMVGSFVFDSFDYVALGHLHGPQIINEHIRYCGTPMAYSFGKEEKQDKGVVILDTDTMEQKFVLLNQLHKRTTLKDTFDVLMKADYAADVLDGYVRLEVTDSYIGLDMIASFKERYKNLFEVSGKNLERESAKITMSMEEFEAEQKDPEAIFKRYCEDILEEKPSAHALDLFCKALHDYEGEAVER